LAQFTWLKPGVNETGLVRKNSIVFGVRTTFVQSHSSSLNLFRHRACLKVTGDNSRRHWCASLQNREPFFPKMGFLVPKVKLPT